MDLAAFRSESLPDQDALLRNWFLDSAPVVSVICNTYNQEGYIEDALRGFLLQKTKFRFEIIVNDDASTDSTADIVEAYVLRYPKIIKLHRQESNQYSKGKKPTLLAFPHTKGDLIALCEGDDFWIDSYKLSKQVSLMHDRPDVTICVHSCYGLVENKKLVPRYIGVIASKCFDAQEVADKLGQYAPTASYLMRRSVIETLPKWFESTSVGDFYYEVNGALTGKGFYMADIMSVYRVNAAGSWTSSFSSSPAKSMLKNSSRWIEDIQLMSADERFSVLDLSKRQSVHYCYLAMAYALIADFDEFVRHIELSVIARCDVSRGQMLLYKFRRSSVMVRILVKLLSFR